MAKPCVPSVPAGLPIRGWFADSHPDFRRDLVALARPRFYAAGSVLFQAGDDGTDVLGVTCGVVSLQCRFTHSDALLVQMLWPGDWFGTPPALFERSRRATAIARTDVEVLRVPGDELRALLRRRPAWYAELGRDVVYWLDISTQGLVDLLIRDTSARCAAVLLRLAGRRWASDPDAGLPSEIPASHAEIAMLCNVSRNTFSRVVKEFSSRRLVTLNYRSLTLNDPSRLRALADSG